MRNSNQRLDDGASATSLVDWLNALPEVQALVQTQFGGHPIREQNLSQWKNGGFLDWVRQQEALELAERLLRKRGGTGREKEDRPPLSEVLTLWLATRRYAVAHPQRSPRTEGPEGWKLLRQMFGDAWRSCAAATNMPPSSNWNANVTASTASAWLWSAPASHRTNSPKPKPEPERPWSQWTKEEKIAWARRPGELRADPGDDMTPSGQMTRNMRWVFGQATEEDMKYLARFGVAAGIRAKASHRRVERLRTGSPGRGYRTISTRSPTATKTFFARE